MAVLEDALVGLSPLLQVYHSATGKFERLGKN